jgi:hypothetical protein
MLANSESKEPNQEIHAATSLQGCNAIEKRLIKMGLRIRLIEAINIGKGDLPYICIFEGLDSDPEAERFTSPHDKDN